VPVQKIDQPRKKEYKGDEREDRIDLYFRQILKPDNLNKHKVFELFDYRIAPNNRKKADG
jgi:hypothetical protein